MLFARHTTQPRRRLTRRVPVMLLLTSAAFTAACTNETPTEIALESGARVVIVQETDPNALILIDPKNATLHVGAGLIYQARVIDANGQVVLNARPTWRSTTTTVATVDALPDSAGVDATRARVAAISVGSARIIASFGGVSDTSTLTVIARPDTGTTSGPPGGGTTTPTRPLAFDATILVRGFVASSDTSTTGTLLVPGTTVTLTRLPSIAGDSLPTGVTPVTVPTVVGTVTVDATSQAVFRGVPQSRFRVDVSPPAGSGWQAGEFVSGPPQVATYTRVVTLRKP